MVHRPLDRIRLALPHHSLQTAVVTTFGDNGQAEGNLLAGSEMTRSPTLEAVDLEVIPEVILGVTLGATRAILTSLAVWPTIRARAWIACDRLLQMQ